MIYANISLLEDLGVADGRIIRIIVGWAKNNSGNERSPVHQLLYPVRENIFVCPALVSLHVCSPRARVYARVYACLYGCGWVGVCG
jgi:hypothetical protein